MKNEKSVKQSLICNSGWDKLACVHFMNKHYMRIYVESHKNRLNGEKGVPKTCQVTSHGHNHCPNEHTEANDAPKDSNPNQPNIVYICSEYHSNSDHKIDNVCYQRNYNHLV